MNKPAELETEPFYSTQYKCTLYAVSIVNGPRWLLARTTVESALKAGSEYAEEYYERTADGNGWQPVRYSGPFLPGKDFL